VDAITSVALKPYAGKQTGIRKQNKTAHDRRYIDGTLEAMAGS
jgi:hypothetical protein